METDVLRFFFLGSQVASTCPACDCIQKLISVLPPRVLGELGVLLEGLVRAHLSLLLASNCPYCVKGHSDVSCTQPPLLSIHMGAPRWPGPGPCGQTKKVDHWDISVDSLFFFFSLKWIIFILSFFFKKYKQNEHNRFSAHDLLRRKSCSITIKITILRLHIVPALRSSGYSNLFQRPWMKLWVKHSFFFFY